MKKDKRYYYWKKKFEEEREKERTLQDKFNVNIAVPILISIVTSLVINYLMRL